MGGVAGVLTTTNLGRSGDATMSPRGLPRPTPVVGLGILYLIVLLEFTCICCHNGFPLDLEDHKT